jgi:hypothetical protein
LFSGKLNDGHHNALLPVEDKERLDIFDEVCFLTIFCKNFIKLYVSVNVRYSTYLITEGTTLETELLVTVYPAAPGHSPPEQQEYPKQGTVSQCRLGRLLLHSFHTAQGTHRYPANLQHFSGSYYRQVNLAG